MGDVSYYSVEKRKGSQGEASANWKTIIGFVDKDEKSYMSKWKNLMTISMIIKQKKFIAFI